MNPLASLVFFAWILGVQLTGLGVFTKGFFLTRVELGKQSECDVRATNPLIVVVLEIRRCFCDGDSPSCGPLGFNWRDQSLIVADLRTCRWKGRGGEIESTCSPVYPPL